MSTKPKIPFEEARARRMRKAARAEACLDRLEKYALGELEDDITKGELDALKYLVSKTLPAYEPPRASAAEKVVQPAHTFIIQWSGNTPLPAGSRFEPIDVEVIPNEQLPDLRSTDAS
jgi:hypothetical protein